jgi:hypothetical protein
VFPDATFIITHRDPIDVAVSTATMMTYTVRMGQGRRAHGGELLDHPYRRDAVGVHAGSRSASGRSHEELRRGFAPDVERFVTS